MQNQRIGVEVWEGFMLILSLILSVWLGKKYIKQG